MTNTTAQPFIIDANLVGGSPEILISSVILYCKSRPGGLNNPTGTPFPSVKMVIVKSINGLPDFTTGVENTNIAKTDYISIIPSIDATAETKFVFTTPVVVETNKQYFFCISQDMNLDFIFWKHVTGEYDLITKEKVGSIISPTIENIIELTNDSSSWQAISGAVYKFKINACKFFNNGTPIGNNGSYVLHNDKFEFVKYDYNFVNLLAGEYVYKKKITPDGNCSVVSGNNYITLGSANVSSYFSNNNEPKIIVVDNGTYRNVRRILSSNGTAASVDAPFSFTNTNAYYYAAVPIAKVFLANNSKQDSVSKYCILTNSTSNSTVHFANGDTLVGEDSGASLANCIFSDISVYDATSLINVNLFSGTDFTLTDTFNYSTDGVSTTIDPHSEILQSNSENYILSKPTVLMSRSNEVQLINVASYTNANSSVLTININSTSDYAIPTLPNEPAVIQFTRYLINNDYTNENTMYGNAISKEVSTKISLNENQFAEDIIVYIQAYRPSGTDFKVFAKLYNTTADSDFFDDKDWTLLNIVQNANVYSSSSNTSDLVEYSFEMPLCPNTAFTYNSTVTVSNNQSNVVAATGVFSANIAVGDVVKIYSPLFPNTNFFVASVVAVVNSTVITIDTPTTNNSLLGAGMMIDHIDYKLQAFKNIANSNVIRYYNSANAYVDMFNSFAIKTVFLSETDTIIPFLSSVRCVAVSA